MGVVSPLIPVSNTRLSAPGNSLADCRASLRKDIGAAVPLVKILRFIQLVLPPLRPELSTRFASIMERLEDPRSGGYNATSRRWRAFPDSSSTSENKHFAHLVGVVTAITGAVTYVFHPSAPPHQLMVFANSPDNSPTSDWRTTRHRPDGYFVLCEPAKPTDEKPHWMDMGPTGEYKLGKGENDVLDNTSKVLWNMYHSLRDDPRRRFAFAFSIEKEEMRLWYANRAEVLVSEKFNFMSSPQFLVRFFLSFLYGAPEAVGWDPTMVYIADSDPPQYRITVNDAKGKTKVYKTLGLESSVGAEVLRGRGTRVWRAVCCDPKTFKVSAEEPEVALKDCWVDLSREKEGDVILKLRNLAAERIKTLQKQLEKLKKTRKVPRPKKQPDVPQETPKTFEEVVKAVEDQLDAAKALAASLPAPVIHGVVSLPGSAGPDRTLLRDTVFKDENGKNVSWEYIFQEQKLTKTEDSPLDKLQSQLKGEHRSTYQYLRLVLHRECIMYDSKHHYRLVYGDVCTSLYQVKRLDMIFLHLAHVTQALRGLHEAGWVHRDVSAGNILVTTDGVVKLSDWEYAKELDTDHSMTHDIRTGTIDFMSVEVDKGKYLFASATSPPDYTSFDRPQEEELSSTPKPSSGWCYNPLHDVESVFWLTKFFTENHDVIFISKQSDLELNEESLAALGIRLDPPTHPRSERLIAQSTHVEELFHGSSERLHEIQIDRKTADLWYLHPELIRGGIFHDLENIRSVLYHRYRDVEDGFAEDPSKPFTHHPKIYRIYYAALRTMAKSVGKIPAYVHVAPLARAVLPVQEASKATEVDPPNYPPAAAAPTIPPADRDDADSGNPRVEETTAITAKLQSVTLDPSPASLLRPTSSKESHPQSSIAASRPTSRAASRAPSRAPSRTGLRSQSRAASRPPSRAAPRPPSRTGLRSQSRAAANTPSEPRHGSPSDSRPELPPASRPGSRAGLRSASRAQARTGDTDASAANAAPAGSKTKQGTSRSTSSGTSSKGKGKGRATSPIPPVPSSSRTRPPVTQGSAGAGKSNAGRPSWR